MRQEADVRCKCEAGGRVRCRCEASQPYIYSKQQAELHNETVKKQEWLGQTRLRVYKPNYRSTQQVPCPTSGQLKNPPGVRKTISVSCMQGMQEGNCIHTHRHVYTQLNKNLRKAPEDIIIKCQVLET